MSRKGGLTEPSLPDPKPKNQVPCPLMDREPKTLAPSVFFKPYLFQT